MSQVPPSTSPGFAPIQTIRTTSGVTAQVALPAADTPVADTLHALGLTHPCPVIVAIGSAAEIEPHLAARLAGLFGRSVIAAASEAEAIVVDGGTDAGIIAALGASTAGRANTPTLIGVAPRGKVILPNGDPAQGGRQHPLEPHHSHFIVPPGDTWGDETATLYDAAQQIASGCPVVTVLAGGGNVARKEVVQSVRRKWPVFVLTGSGRLADDIARAKAQPSAPIDDALLAEIVADGDVRLVPVETDPAEFRRSLMDALTNDVPLRGAWEQQRLYSDNAIRHQKAFFRLQNAILWLGVCVTILALSLAYVRTLNVTLSLAGLSVPLDGALRWVVIIAPILLSICLAAATRFNSGERWLVLRAGAEAVKRETFRYRTRTGLYSQTNLAQVGLSREGQLAAMLETVTRQWIDKEGNTATFRVPRHDYPMPKPRTVNGVTDDRLSRLTPEDYIAVRLDDQRAYYRRNAATLETRQTRFQWLALLLGGAGTFFAAVSLELVVPVVTAMATALLAYLDYRQTANTIRQYVYAERALADIRGWWDTLSDPQQKKASFDTLVERTEATIQSEMVGWVQQMQTALTELHRQQTQNAATPLAPTPSADSTLPSPPSALG